MFSGIEIEYLPPNRLQDPGVKPCLHFEEREEEHADGPPVPATSRRAQQMADIAPGLP